MTPQFFWYQLMTPDPAAARDFYGAVVGWQGRDFGNGAYTVLEMDGNGVGGIALLDEVMAQAGGRPMWAGYIQTFEVDAAVERVRQAGGTVYHEPETIPNVGRFAMVTDAQGAVFMLMTPMPPGGAAVEGRPGAPGFHMTALGRSAWSELHATDWEKAWDFYSAQFGWSQAAPFDMGPMDTYQIFEANGAPIGGMFNSPGVAHPYWVYYFNVASIDAAVAAIKAGGGSVINGPDQVPGGTWTVQATDPQGATFGLTAANR